MTELSAPFAPDWVSPPGDTIDDIAEERGWTQAELAQRLGYSEKHLSQLINGKVSITVDAAQRLERVLGSTMEFWLAREANYQKHKARIEAERRHAEWVPWLEELPLKELMVNGAIEKKRLVAKNKPGLVETCLRFFGVASPDEWRAHYGGMEVAFRRSREEQSDVGAISAWLRMGEQQAEQLDGPKCPKYNKARFQQALQTIRGLTCLPPQEFEPQMRQLLHDAGVLLVLVPAIPRSHVSGVARWLSPSRPLIQLSLYGKSNDKFWFTFFHEAAHILLHAGSREAKKSVFLDDPSTSHNNDPQEHEANQWAGERLIPAEHNDRLLTLTTQAEILQFAEEINIHPGIVVGRLQHEGLLSFATVLNRFKESFQLRTAEHD